MTLHEILDTVSSAIGVDRGQAEKVTRAFLETLSLRLGSDEARELASQLPTELQDCLAPTDPEVSKLTPDEFIARFAQSAGLGPTEAVQAAHGVWDALNRSVTGGEMDDVRSQLPNELVDVFEGRRATHPTR